MAVVPLFQLFPPDERARLQSRMRRVTLETAKIIVWPGRTMDLAYFPIDCVISVLTFGNAGESVEAGLIGREGVAGLPLFLRQSATPHQYQCQVPGDAWRMNAADFVEESRRPGPLHDGLLAYTQAYITVVAQTALCNARHSVDERCARWLLCVHDRVGRDTFPLTHEFLAIMLSVRRPGVTVALGALQRAGAVSYHRGEMTVTDRAALEAAACPCYAITSSQYPQL